MLSETTKETNKQASRHKAAEEEEAGRYVYSYIYCACLLYLRTAANQHRTLQQHGPQRGGGERAVDVSENERKNDEECANVDKTKAAKSDTQYAN